MNQMLRLYWNDVKRIVDSTRIDFISHCGRILQVLCPASRRGYSPFFCFSSSSTCFRNSSIDLFDWLCSGLLSESRNADIQRASLRLAQPRAMPYMRIFEPTTMTMKIKAPIIIWSDSMTLSFVERDSLLRYTSPKRIGRCFQSVKTPLASALGSSVP